MARSGGSLLGTNWALAVEGIASHLLTAFFLAKWLRTIPLRTLTTVFETPSKLPQLAALASSPERRAQIGEIARQGERKRLSLARWRNEERDVALQQRWFEQNNEKLLQNIVAVELGCFRSAEEPGSAAEKAAKKRIKAWAKEASGRLCCAFCGIIRYKITAM